MRQTSSQLKDNRFSDARFFQRRSRHSEMAQPSTLQKHAPTRQEVSPYLPHRRMLLQTRRIRELSDLRPARAIVDICACWAVILAMLALVSIARSWWIVLVAIPVIGNRYYALFIIGHDAMHRRLFPNIKKNDFWADLLILAPIGAITRLNNGNHLAHHRYLATSRDPDRFKHACFNKAESVSFITFLLGLSSVGRAFRAVFLTRGEKSGQEAHSSYTLRDLVLLAGWLIVGIGGLTWFIGWWAYPVLWLFPVYCFMYLADNFRSFAEHSHPESDSLADHHRLITYLSNPVERALVAPMNMNYHTAHHLWPSIPYYNLPTADKEIRRKASGGELEWRKSYIGYLIRYWFALPLAECQEKA